MAVRLWTKRQEKKTDRGIYGPRFVFPSTVQCRTQVSIGGQGMAGMEEYWGYLSQLSGRKGLNFQSIRILSGPGHMPSPGEQRSSATASQTAMLCPQETGDRTLARRLALLAFVRRRKIPASARLSNTCYPALFARKCFASSGLQIFCSHGLK